MRSAYTSPTILVFGNVQKRVVSFTPRPICLWRKKPSSYQIRGFVDPRAGMEDDEVRKILPLPGIEPGRAVHGPSLYQLIYYDCTQIFICALNCVIFKDETTCAEVNLSLQYLIQVCKTRLH
jgi:hypothetical protein